MSREELGVRPIKFRAWSPMGKHMSYDPYGDEYLCEGTPINDIFKNPYADHIYMQYTCLKDKNGKEIYEGDIVKVPYIDPMGGINYDEKNDPEYLGTVKFVRGSFMVKRQYEPEPHLLEKWIARTQGEYVSNYGNLTIYADHTIFEVIGNIYENPDLIQERE